jgi:hypothetical protein
MKLRLRRGRNGHGGRTPTRSRTSPCSPARHHSRADRREHPDDGAGDANLSRRVGRSLRRRRRPAVVRTLAFVVGIRATLVIAAAVLRHA